MIQIHETFICKPGNASKLAKLMKEFMSEFDETVSVLTDVTGQFNKVVIVSQHESLTAYEESWKKYEQDTEKMKKMEEAFKGYTDMYLTGSREIYRVW
jgi:hypothetical protein